MLSRLLHRTRGSETVEGVLALVVSLGSRESFSNSAAVEVGFFPFEVSETTVGDFFNSFRKGSLGWRAIKSLKSSWAIIWSGSSSSTWRIRSCA